MSAALKEAIGLLVLLAIGFAAAAWRLSRPLDAQTLAVQVATQHSLAQEAVLLARQQGLGRFAFDVDRQHAAQLAEQIGSGADSLQSASVKPEVKSQRDAAVALVREARTHVLALEGGGAGTDANQIQGIASALKSLDEELERAGQ